MLSRLPWRSQGQPGAARIYHWPGCPTYERISEYKPVEFPNAQAKRQDTGRREIALEEKRGAHQLVAKLTTDGMYFDWVVAHRSNCALLWIANPIPEKEGQVSLRGYPPKFCKNLGFASHKDHPA